MSGSVELEKFIDELIERSKEKGHISQIFIDMRRQHGTVEAIKRLVTSKNIQKGFKRLGELNLLDLSVEAAVLRFPEEFTHEEQESAKWRLDQVRKDFDLEKEEVPQTAEDYFNRAFKRYTQGNYDGAISDCTEGLLQQSNNIYAWLNRGNAWAKKGEYDEAIADYNRAIHLEPNFTVAWSSRGEAWYGKGEYDKAIDDLSEALRLGPNSSNAWRIRGDAWRRSGKYDEAIADYNKALHFFPENEEIKQNLNVALALQASEAEREEIIENLKLEYNKKLKEGMDKSVGKILEDETEFRFSHAINRRASFLLRLLAVIILLIISCVWGYLFVRLFDFDTQKELQALDQNLFFSWAPILATFTTPLLLLVWLLLRWGYETKTVSYAFQWRATLEERILLYFRNDIKTLKDMQKFFVTHWMENSPLEVMLIIGGKRKHGEETPMDALTEKLKELTGNFKGKTSEGGD